MTARPFDLERARALLAHTPELLRTRLAGLPPDWEGADEGVDTFSPFEVVGHLVHGERADWIPRLELLLEHGPDVTFEPYDRFAQREESRGKSLADLLDEFEELRTANLARLGDLALDEAALDRTARHPELGPVTARQLIAAWMVHDLSHLSQINRVIAHQWRDEVGPWSAYMRILGGRA